MPIMWKKVHSIVLFLIVLMVVVGAVWGARTGHPLFAWVYTMGMLTVFLFVCGQGITGRWAGALIDDRNVMSLSRFQMAAWTILILSGFLAAAMWNIANIGNGSKAADEAVKIALPASLWGLMGLSTVSLVGSPLILAGKAAKAGDPNETLKTLQLLSEQGDPTNRLGVKGQLITNDSPTMARVSDLFTGEEVGNAAHLDVARLQMFFFTVVTLTTYGAMLWHLFGNAGLSRIEQLPPMDQSLVALIAISHAGYLASKAAPHSRAADADAGAASGAAAPDQEPAMG